MVVRTLPINPKYKFCICWDIPNNKQNIFIYIINVLCHRHNTGYSTVQRWSIVNLQWWHYPRQKELWLLHSLVIATEVGNCSTLTKCRQVMHARAVGHWGFRHDADCSLEYRTIAFKLQEVFMSAERRAVYKVPFKIYGWSQRKG